MDDKPLRKHHFTWRRLLVHWREQRGIQATVDEMGHGWTDIAFMTDEQHAPRRQREAQANDEQDGVLMILHRHEPLGDAPPDYRQHFAATWRQNLVLALLGALGAGLAWGNDSHRLVQTFFFIMGGVGLLQLAMGGCVVLWSLRRPGRASTP